MSTIALYQDNFFFTVMLIMQHCIKSVTLHAILFFFFCFFFTLCFRVAGGVAKELCDKG